MNDEQIRAIERPHRNLMKMYFLKALLANVAFPIVIWPLFFKYITLRYKLDDEGVSARWGILFRKEIYLTYKRIQDIHVKRNVFERWLGIGTVEVQTASGSPLAELKLEGMEDYETVRDYLYGRMRGHEGAAPKTTQAAPAAGGDGDVVALLNEIRDELAGARSALEQRADR